MKNLMEPQWEIIGLFFLKLVYFKLTIVNNFKKSQQQKRTNMDRPLSINPISALQSTGGAIPVRNEKGEISMQKVKVQRYVAGKR